jgi:TrmH family RNA methyltransferase
LVVEGPVLIAEAVAAGWELEGQFVAPGGTPVDGAGPVWTLAEGALERIVDTESPRGVVAVARTPPADPGLLATAAFAVVVDQVADPGNLGTILRSAEAAGADVVVTTPGTVDVHAPKVVRSSAGALFHVPVVRASLAAVAAAGLRLVGTSSHQGRPHTDADWTGRVAIVVGNESHGVAADAPVESWVRIDHRGRAESLNVAMATTLLCFEVARHREV